MPTGEMRREEIVDFLEARHREDVEELELLRGGYWSTAYGYRAGGRDLVARFGRMRHGYEMDRLACTFAQPGLPVPEVVEIGDTFDGAYAISVRARGRFLEDISVPDAPLVAPAFDGLLAGLRLAGGDLDGPSAWYPPGADQRHSTWRRWLLDGLVDHPGQTVSGWRVGLASHPAVERLFEECRERVSQLVEACPERRDLVHGDLLHQNVLVADDLSRLTAVVSWKCSVRGDFLFDAAWCTFWGSWHDGIAAMDVWDRTWRAADLTGADLVDAAERHHCYELQIGASHLGWHVWTGDAAGLAAVADRLTEILERGPLPAGHD